MQTGNVIDYEKAFDITLKWIKTYPAKTNKWGPFFEDVPRWSDTQINAVTYAMYLMDYQELDPDWMITVKNIDVWLTDGYGDYVRHYIRAMASAPELAPDNSDHMLRTSSIVRDISYQPFYITYEVYDNNSDDLFRLVSKPKEVIVNGIQLKQVKDDTAEGWGWRPLPSGGVLTLKQSIGNKIEIIYK
ncbi:MAG: hypothetical protein V1903_05145 [Bacteroidota bacterium]